MSGKIRNPARRCKICGGKCKKQFRYCKLCTKERREILTQSRVTAPCGGSRPIGKRTRRAERVPRDAENAEGVEK